MDHLLDTLRRQTLHAWDDSLADLRDTFEAIIEPLLPELEDADNVSVYGQDRDECSVCCFP